MSFWSGVAKGFKDAKEAKAEQEELDARRAERKETFEYNVRRDDITVNVLKLRGLRIYANGISLTIELH